MAKNETRRLLPAALQQDRDSASALRTLSGYAPANSAFTLAKVQAALNNMDAAQEAYTQALVAFEAAKSDLIASEWAFHNVVLGAKDQVVAQYGADSNEVQAVGLKKKSEYKAPQRSASKAATTPTAA